MLVTLTFRELLAVQAAATDRHAPYLADSVQISTNRHEVAMPPAAWRALLGPLRDRAVNDYGQWVKKAPGARAALVKLTRLLSELEQHPAMHCGCVPEGHGRDILTCFAGENGYSPYPTSPDDWHLFVLYPHDTTVEVDVGGGPVKLPAVYWRLENPHPSFGGRGIFLDPDEHRGWDQPK